MSQAMLSVSSLNTKIKSLLEATFVHTLVEGEVASLTYHSSGHLYFSIKDAKSAIKCVMWRSSVAKMKFRIEKGMHIVVEGSVSVYTPRGEYQFQTVKIEPYGQGALALAYEQLKEKLKNQGYFDPAHKKQIPKQIEKIALVTAKESAALHDMLKIIEKRWPLMEVKIIDTLVQGEQAGFQIAHALRYADSLAMDVVVVGRGGGSAEDLWSFNEEAVANAIYAMRTPVVSAVGHEVDVMISDFVADLRAPTPSAAMEMILPDKEEMLYLLSELQDRMKYSIQEQITRKAMQVKHSEEMVLRLSPLRMLQQSQEKFIQLREEFKRIIRYKLEQSMRTLPSLEQGVTQSIVLTLQKKEQLLALLEQKMIMHDPKKMCKEGWAQVSKEGKSVSLSEIDVEERIILEDATTRIEALCINKAGLLTEL